MVLVQVAETVTGRTDFARQIMLRMMLPQVVLILLAALAVWYAVGRGLAPLDRAPAGDREPLPPRPLARCRRSRPRRRCGR